MTRHRFGTVMNYLAKILQKLVTCKFMIEKMPMNLDKINPLAIIAHFYPRDDEMRRLLIAHSTQVADKAFAIATTQECCEMEICKPLVLKAAMLHDIGVGRCHAPGIFCHGDAPYIAHGIIGAQMLREWGKLNDVDVEPLARIAECHTGSGITAAEVEAQELPIPIRDYLPETLEEKLVCLADKFYSKSRPDQELPYDAVRRQMSRFGSASLDRFDKLCALFHV